MTEENEKINSFTFYRDWYEALKFLENDAQKCEEMWAILEYIFDQKLPEKKGGFLFFMAKPLIDKNLGSSKAGKFGGRPKIINTDSKKVEKKETKKRGVFEKQKGGFSKNKKGGFEHPKKPVFPVVKDEDFERFYQEYGSALSRNSRKTALEKWELLRKRGELPNIDLLIQKVQEYKASLDPKDNDQYKQGIQVFLANKRWLDEFKKFEEYKPKEQIVRGQQNQTYKPYKPDFKDSVGVPSDIKEKMKNLANLSTKAEEIPF